MSQMISLADRVTRAREQQTEQEEYAALRVYEDRRLTLRETLFSIVGGGHRIDITRGEDNSPIATIEGFRFTLDGWDNVRQLGACPQCGPAALSRPISTLTSIAPDSVFRPGFDHSCPTLASEPSLAERLVDLLREVVRGEGGQP